MLTLLSLLLLLQNTQATSCTPPENVYFSEYIEGSSHNKALELYNGSISPVDLSCLRVEMYFNGAPEPEFQVDLSGNLPAGEVFVLWHEQGEELALHATATQNKASGFGWFNGDDAILLVSGTTVLDSIGTVGTRPSSSWGEEVRTKDRTLRRDPSITEGDADPTDAYDPALEWIQFDKDTFDGLGSR